MLLFGAMLDELPAPEVHAADPGQDTTDHGDQGTGAPAEVDTREHVRLVRTVRAVGGYSIQKHRLLDH